MSSEGPEKGIVRGRLAIGRGQRPDARLSAFASGPVARGELAEDATVVGVPVMEDGDWYDRPDASASAPTSRRWLSRPEVAASLLSFVWPGLGQARLGMLRWAAFLAVPPLLLVLGVAAWALSSPEGFVLRLLVPAVALGMLALVAVHGIWRVLAIVDAWLRARPRRLPLRHDRALPLVIVLTLVVALLHGVAGLYIGSFNAAAQPVFGGSTPQSETDVFGGLGPDTGWGTWDEDLPGEIPPGDVLPAEGPLNMLLLGVDWMEGRSHGLTDTIMVVSFNEQTGESSQISVPRDTGRVELWNGVVYQNRINSLLNYFKNRPDEYPEGPLPSFARAVGHILGVRIHYYAVINIPGFEGLIDSIGGLDFTLEHPIIDNPHKFYLDAGRHHLNGRQALMVARSRYGPNNNDYQRAKRQQALLRAIADRLRHPSVAARLPEIAAASAEVIRTNVPVDHLGEFVDLLEQTKDATPRKVVLSPPKYSERIPMSQTGGRWMTQLKMDAVKELSIELFGEFSRYSQ